MAQIHYQNRSSSSGREEKQKQRQKHKDKDDSYTGCMGRMVNLFELSNGGVNSQKFLTEIPHGDGNGCVRKGMDVTKMAMNSIDNSFPCELRSSSKPASGMPMKRLIADEMLKETDIRRRSPNVVARLMGLDALPAQPTPKQPRKTSKTMQKTPGKHHSCPLTDETNHEQDRVFMEKHVSYESHSFRKIEKVTIEEPNNFSSKRGTTSSKWGERKMAFIRQKFMDAKHLATNENLCDSKEFHDALEVLDSNKDLFMRFLQEPDSLFTKHLHDLPTPTRPSHIRVLKSSNNYINSEMYQKSERKTKGGVKLQGHMNFQHKHEESHVSCNKNAAYPSHRSSQSQIEGKSEACLLPTRIVVLKPSLAKAQTTVRSGSSSSPVPCLQTDHRKHREFRKSVDWDLFHEERDWPKNGKEINDEITRQRPKGSREIAREITRKMRQNGNIGSMKLSRSARNGYAGEDERAENDSGNDSGTLTPVTGNLYDRNDRFSPSSSYSRESSVSKEAKKHLLQRWKLMHRVQDSAQVGRGLNTLGEMLALPEVESPRKEMGKDSTLDYREVTGWGCPLGISSKDGWKESSPRNLQRSRSVPASFTVNESPSGHGSERGFILEDAADIQPERPVKGRSFNRKVPSPGSRKSNGKKSQSVLHYGSFDDSQMKSILHAVEIDSSADDLRNKLAESDLSVEKAVISQSFSGIDDTRQLESYIEAEECGDSQRPFESQRELLVKPTECLSRSVEDEIAVAPDQNVLITEVPFSEYPQSGSPQAHHKPGLHEMEPESPGSSKGTGDQPSPISVLEPPFEEDISTSDCFEQVSAGLQGLRMQLNLLKMESVEGNMDAFSDEEYGEAVHDHLVEPGKSPSTCHGENTDFTFMFNVLVSSGFHDFNSQEELTAAWYLPELPIDPCIFEKLERLCGVGESMWSRSERKLLFDRINSSLMEVLGPCLDPHPWVDSRVRNVGPLPTGEVLVEKVWRLLDQGEEERFGRTLGAVMKKDLGKGSGWLELGDYVDMIGREMEGNLMDALLEEVYGLCAGH